jgi:hypothetical protein
LLLLMSMESYQRILDLKSVIMKAIKHNDYDVSVLLGILGPMDKCVENPLFIANLKQVVDVILQDRDGNNKFTVKDLELLGKDVIGVTTLVTSILLVLGTVPELKLKYKPGATEELVFKVLAYVFLVIVPKETGNPWNLEEKKAVVDLTVLIYQLVISSQSTKDAVAAVIKWFNAKGLCKCMSGESEEQKNNVVQKHMPKLQVVLANSVQNNKDKIKMQEEINALQISLAKLDGGDTQ